MKGFFTVAARLSDGAIISAKVPYAKYLGAKLLTDERYFLKFYDECFGLKKERLVLETEEETIEQYYKFEMQTFLLAPYHYGICFIDFMNKTIAYFNINHRLRYVKKSEIAQSINLFFNQYHEEFQKNPSKSAKDILNEIFESDMKQVHFSNFFFAKENRWIKEALLRESKIVEKEYDFKMNDLLSYAIHHTQEDLPEMFSYVLPGWTVIENFHDIDFAKFFEVKSYFINQDILTDSDMVGWNEYEKKIFNRQ